MFSAMLIRNARVFTPIEVWQPGWLLVEDGRIAAMAPGEPPEFDPERISMFLDARGGMLLPGFIDLHVHGAVGHEVMDANPHGLVEMARYFARHGVTAWLATTWTATPAAIQQALQAVGQVVGRVPGGATILGVHLEGPFLNPAKAGAQDRALIRRATPEEALAYLNSGLVRLVAVAPEYLENTWFLDECARRGVAVSAGHTTAGLDELKSALSHGLHQVTHCFNGMVGLGHRELGTVGAAMAIPEIRCELIADNIHVHPAAQKILIDVKTPNRVILITDSLRGNGLPDGDYPIDNRIIHIRNGEVRLDDGTLAGSVLTMERALHNAWQNSGRSLVEAWPMSSLNAARAINFSASKGSLEPGKDADLVLLNDSFEVQLTIAEGEVVYQVGAPIAG
jgi:N-acetylglucosamine-6-phosphate deacetylase